MKKSNKFTMALVVATLAVGMASTGASQLASDSTDNSTVTVQVSTKIAVDISPSDLQYGVNGQTLEPGDFESFTSNSDGTAYSAVEIENTGSENISQVWLNTSVPQERPFGTGTASAYDAGNFIQVRPTGESDSKDDAFFSFVNRREYNASDTLDYVFRPNLNGRSEEWHYGRLRTGDQEFFWAVNTTSGAGTCDTSTDSFRVGINAHNRTETGSTNFRSSGNWNGYTLTSLSGDKFLAEGITPDIPNQANNPTYDVVVDCDDTGGTYTTWTRYNPKAEGATDLQVDGTATQHVLNASTTAGQSDQELQPGENFAVNTSVKVPQGVASGNGISGTLRVFVNSLEP